MDTGNSNAGTSHESVGFDNLQMEILSGCLNTDIFRIIIEYSRNSMVCITPTGNTGISVFPNKDGYIHIRPLYEFVLSRKIWWKTLLPYLKEVAKRQKEITRLSSLVFGRALRFVSLSIYLNCGLMTLKSMISFHLGSLKVESLNIANPFVSSGKCPFVEGGNCKYSVGTGNTATEKWCPEQHYQCLFELLLKYQRSGKASIISYFDCGTLKDYPSIWAMLKNDDDQNKLQQEINEKGRYVDAVLLGVSLLEGAKIDGKDFIKSDCKITPGSIFKWMNSIWNMPDMPILLENLRKEIDVPDYEFKVTVIELIGKTPL